MEMYKNVIVQKIRSNDLLLDNLVRDIVTCICNTFLNNIPINPSDGSKDLEILEKRVFQKVRLQESIKEQTCRFLKGLDLYQPIQWGCQSEIDLAEAKELWTKAHFLEMDATVSTESSMCA